MNFRYKLTNMLWLRMAVRAVVGIAVTIVCAASPLAAQNAADDHPAQYPAADVAVGSRVYGTLCVTCHGPTGTGVSGVDLHRGPIRRGATDTALRAFITSGAPASGMPSFKLEPAELTGLVAFIRAGFDASSGVTAVLGDAARGRAVFEGQGRCLTCHRVGDRGVDSAPDLTDVGRLRTPTALQLALVDPSKGMQPINRPVRAVTRDGTVVTGRRLNEDMYTVQIITTDSRLVSLVKPELREWTVQTVSTMPSYKDTLTSTELADLVGYMVSLKGSRP